VKITEKTITFLEYKPEVGDYVMFIPWESYYKSLNVIEITPPFKDDYGTIIKIFEGPVDKNSYHESYRVEVLWAYGTTDVNLIPKTREIIEESLKNEGKFEVWYLHKSFHKKAAKILKEAKLKNIK